MTNQKINPQKLIPDYWYGIYVPTEADLVFLGSKNLEYLKQYWRREEREIVGHVKTVQAQIDMLDGKTVDDIKAMAAEYEHPEFPKIGIPNTPGNWAKKPEPLDADSINRKPGTTTFNFCGWCKHCEGGIGHYGYYITATCPLIPEELNNGSLKTKLAGLVAKIIPEELNNGRETYGHDKFRFNTPCVIANGTQEFLETCVEYLKTKLAGLVAKKAEISEYVRFIAKAMKQAEEKPYLAGHRPSDWFELGDEVVCFIPKDFETALKKGIFVTGKVIYGYRHGDGCVSVCADEQVHTDDYCDGCGLGYGLSRPEVMHKWEYEYLKTHPDYLKVWVRASADLTKFNSREMTKAFAKLPL